MSAKPRIVCTDGTCGGRPRIDGTRITTALVWSAEQQKARDMYANQVTDEQWAAALDYECMLRDTPLPDAEVEYLGTLAMFVERSTARSTLDGQREHGLLAEVLDLACERVRLDNVAGLRGLAAAGVDTTSELIQSLRYPLERKRKGAR